MMCCSKKENHVFLCYLMMQQERNLRNIPVYEESLCLFCFGMIIIAVLTMMPIIFLSSVLPEPYGEYVESGYTYYLFYDLLSYAIEN